MKATMNVTDAYRGTAGLYHEGNVSGNTSFNPMKIDPFINQIFNISSIAILFVTMISLGCTMEIAKIKTHFLKPKGVAIALAGQFIIMPLAAFSLAKVLEMDSIKAVTVLICGCCPGGNLSNVFSLAMKGDMNLSIVMTTCSSVAALGLMPLLLYIYCQGFSGLENAVPYRGIIIALVLTLVPCAIGMLINHYRPKYTPYMLKGGLSIMIISSILVGILAGMAVYDMLWMVLTPDILTVSVMMPLTGFTLGYIMSVLCRLDPRCSRTICIEVGCQNIQLCVAILKVAFPPQVIGGMFLFPLVYLTSQCIEATLLVVCFRCYQTFQPPTEEARIYQSVTVGEESKQTKSSLIP